MKSHASDHEELIDTVAHVAHGTPKSYVVGFLVSLALTLASYFIVSKNIFSSHIADVTIVTLAIVQMVVQVFYFLHLGREKKPHWNQISFVFMLLVIGIIVGGSLWIMDSLTERTMTPMTPMDMKTNLHYQH